MTVRRVLMGIVALLTVVQLWASGAYVAHGQEAEEQEEDTSTEGIALSIVPSILTADELTHTVVYIQLVRRDRTPRLAARDVDVSLVSSHPLVAKVPQTVRISEGESYAVATLTTTSTPGKATITAISDDGLTSAAEVETNSPSGAARPFRLELHAAPSTMLPGGRPNGRLSVMLVASDGGLLAAPETIAVLLTSSNPDSVGVRERVTIPKGEHSVTTDMTASNVGAAVIAALSPGFESSFIQVHVVRPGRTADLLKLELSPPIMRLKSGDRPRVIV